MVLGCQVLPGIAHGEVSHPSQVIVGSVSTYHCDAGFVLDGDTSRMCQLDGEWSGEVPVCNGES